jgi:hypothetical protein
VGIIRKKKEGSSTSSDSDSLLKEKKIVNEPANIPYQEIFNIEINGWCHGLSQYPGEISQTLVFSAVQALGASFRRAILEKSTIDIPDIANRLSKASKYLVSEQDIVLRILANFPHPSSVDAESQQIMGQIIDQVDRKFKGIKSLLELKWQKNTE